MFNLKFSCLAAGLACVLSILIGLISGASLFIVFARALGFGALFFVVSAVIGILISKFIPELLVPQELGMPGQIGSKVDVTVGEDTETYSNAALPFEDDSDEDLGNLDSLADIQKQDTRGLDQSEQTPYTNSADEGTATSAVQAASFDDFGTSDLDSMDVLPDLEDMAKAFLHSDETDEDSDDSIGAVVLDETEAKRPSQFSKGKNPAGNFNPKDMAAALQTMLKKDK
ncbi:hypothetical protein FACS1894200_02060 [Spirochaetia bacterium]|nr:hypothetical protein FACS1894200_02060 [Spirochaetia bacterium]